MNRQKNKKRLQSVNINFPNPVLAQNDSQIKSNFRNVIKALHWTRKLLGVCILFCLCVMQQRQQKLFDSFEDGHKCLWVMVHSLSCTVSKQHVYRNTQNYLSALWPMKGNSFKPDSTCYCAKKVMKCFCVTLTHSKIISLENRNTLAHTKLRVYKHTQKNNDQ